MFYKIDPKNYTVLLVISIVLIVIMIMSFIASIVVIRKARKEIKEIDDKQTGFDKNYIAVCVGGLSNIVNITLKEDHIEIELKKASYVSLEALKNAPGVIKFNLTDNILSLYCHDNTKDYVELKNL